MSPVLLEIIGERQDVGTPQTQESGGGNAMGRSAVQFLETGGGVIWHATAI
jgi:hypothetical protein